MSTATAKSPAKTLVHPLVDVLENDSEFLLLADLPGVHKDALELTVEGDQLSISATTDKLEYRRSFALGDDVDVEGIEAKLELGSLALHLPKRAEAKVRRIEIN